MGLKERTEGSPRRENVGGRERCAPRKRILLTAVRKERRAPETFLDLLNLLMDP